jgi:hypothetical protein
VAQAMPDDTTPSPDTSIPRLTLAPNTNPHPSGTSLLARKAVNASGRNASPWWLGARVRVRLWVRVRVRGRDGGKLTEPGWMTKRSWHLVGV